MLADSWGATSTRVGLAMRVGVTAGRELASTSIGASATGRRTLVTSKSLEAVPGAWQPVTRSRS